MLDIRSLRPVQAMAASLLLRYRHLMLALPRQEGKTELGVRAAHDILSSPFDRRGNPAARSTLYLAKNKKAGKKAAREKFARIFHPRDFAVNTEQVINRKHPQAITWFDSVDKEPDRIRGGTYHFIHGSEVAFWECEHGVTPSDVIGKIFMPTFRTTNGYSLLESTNNGYNGWHALWHDDNELTRRYHRLILSLSQLTEMGLVTREEYERIKAENIPEIFDQEYECKWVTFAGRIYAELRADVHIDAGIPWPEAWQTVIAGIDWGYTDASCVLFGYTRGGNIYIFDEIYEREKRLEDLLDIINLHRGVMWPYRSLAAAADHDPARNEELTLRGIPCSPAQKVDTLGNRIQIKELLHRRRLFIHPRCVNLIRDLAAATWDPKKANEIDYKQCSWGHFDAEAALRYLIRELSAQEDDEPDDNPFEGSDPSGAEWELARMRRANEEMAYGG